MIIETIIIALFCAIIFLLGLILWRASEPKIYEPEKILTRGNFDPRHEHYTPHATQRSRSSVEKNMPPAAAAKGASGPDTLTEPEWLKPPPLASATVGMENSEFRDRRRRQDRRTMERRVSIERRQGERRVLAPSYA